MIVRTLPPSARLRWPNLTPKNHSIESPATDDYNCIAWAYGVTDKWMWPGVPDAFWPSDVIGSDELDALLQLYLHSGYQKCDNSELEEGYAKVAVYVNQQGPQHTAIQLESGLWSSKLGNRQDIEHSLDALEGEFYGKPIVFLKKGLT